MLDIVSHSALLLKPDPARVVIRPFAPAEDEAEFVTDTTRAQRIADRVLALKPADVAEELRGIVASLNEHHRDVKRVLLRRFHDINGLSIAATAVSDNQAHLIGGYFSEEYAFEAAALFNPSIVEAPDQAGVPSGALRFILSLRGVGEGHISSITFRTGILNADSSVKLDAPSAQAVPPRIKLIPGGTPDDPGVRLFCDKSHGLSETVIFPVTDHQRHGIEDLRLVRFVDDDGDAPYLGTYTAFGGDDILSLNGHSLSARICPFGPMISSRLQPGQLVPRQDSKAERKNEAFAAQPPFRRSRIALFRRPLCTAEPAQTKKAVS